MFNARTFNFFSIVIVFGISPEEVPALDGDVLFVLYICSKEDIEKCKNRDMLEQILAEFAEHYPEFKEVFVAERDIFLTYSLQNAVATLNAVRKGKIFKHQIQ